MRSYRTENLPNVLEPKGNWTWFQIKRKTSKIDNTPPNIMAYVPSNTPCFWNGYFVFLAILTKPKACIPHSSVILILTGTFLKMGNNGQFDTHFMVNWHISNAVFWQICTVPVKNLEKRFPRSFKIRAVFHKRSSQIFLSHKFLHVSIVVNVRLYEQDPTWSWKILVTFKC